MSNLPALTGQLSLLKHLEQGRYRLISRNAYARAEGLLSLLPAVMHAGEIVNRIDGSILMQWRRHDIDLDVSLQLLCLPDGWVQYAYTVKAPDNNGQAGGLLKNTNENREVITIVRSVLAYLTPKPESPSSVRSLPATP